MSRSALSALVIGLALALAAGACAYDPDLPAPPDEPEPATMTGFSFVIDGELAGMPRPGRREPVAADLAFLASQDIELLVSLTEDVAIEPLAASAHGISVLHLPVPDYTAPTIEQLTAFTTAAHAAIDRGQAVGVHCGAGLGRTGTFLAAYFVSLGMTGDAAIRHVRALRPGSVETAAQEQVVRDYAAAVTHDHAPLTEL